MYNDDDDDDNNNNNIFIRGNKNKTSTAAGTHRFFPPKIGCF